MATKHIGTGGIPYYPAKISQSALTLYVRSTGSDSNDGLTSGTALLTIQAAVNKIPDLIDHAIVLDIGAGTFTNFSCMNRFCSYPGSITFQGTLQTATVSPGTATGTSTGGTVRTLIDSGQSWSTDALKGKFVNVTGVGRFVIESNTSTQITVAGPGMGTSLSGKAYTVQECGTVISSSSSTWIYDCNGVDFRNMRFTGSGPLYIRYCSGAITGTNCSFESTAYSTIGANDCGQVQFTGSIVRGGQSAGFDAGSCELIVFTNGLAYNCGTAYAGAAISLKSVKNSWVTGAVTNQGTGGHGLSLVASECYVGYLNASSNGGHGVSVSNRGAIYGGWLGAYTCELHGTGNTRFGVNLGTDCLAVINGSTDITGSLGNYSFNNSFARTWATDFPLNGDVMIFDDTMSRVERVD